MKTLGPCDVYLSWLNPTPHAIAVYASQPLSPVATPHSLPSGRYSLTWTGLPPAGPHQLRLAHSFQSSRRRLVSPEKRVDHEVELAVIDDKTFPWNAHDGS